MPMRYKETLVAALSIVLPNQLAPLPARTRDHLKQVLYVYKHMTQVSTDKTMLNVQNTNSNNAGTNVIFSFVFLESLSDASFVM